MKTFRGLEGISVDVLGNLGAESNPCLVNLPGNLGAARAPKFPGRLTRQGVHVPKFPSRLTRKGIDVPKFPGWLTRQDNARAQIPQLADWNPMV